MQTFKRSPGISRVLAAGQRLLILLQLLRCEGSHYRTFLAKMIQFLSKSLLVIASLWVNGHNSAWVLKLLAVDDPILACLVSWLAIRSESPLALPTISRRMQLYIPGSIVQTQYGCSNDISNDTFLSQRQLVDYSPR